MRESASSPCQAPPGYWDLDETQPGPAAGPAERTDKMPPPARRTVLFLGTAPDDGAPAASAFNAVAARLGLPWTASTRAPADLTPADFEAAVRVVSLDRAGHEPVVRERVPGRAGAVEYWQVAAAS